MNAVLGELVTRFQSTIDNFKEPEVQAEFWRFLPGAVGWLLCICTILYFNWSSSSDLTPFQITHQSKQNKKIKVASLWIYPIKSCRGIKVDESEICATGFEHERKFMLCEMQVEDGKPVYKMLSIRNQPRMALIDTTIEDGKLIASIDAAHKQSDMTDLSVSIPLSYQELSNKPRIKTKVHKTEVDAFDLGPEYSRFFSEFLGISARLVRYVEGTREIQNFDRAKGEVAFADRYPLLISSERSLALLNKNMRERKEAPLEDERIRPNIILSNTTRDLEEENWKRMLIGQNKVYLIAPCTRCSLPSVDIKTGIKNANNEPKKTIMDKYNGCFGVHAMIHNKEGKIRVGDAVTVVE